jgi:hypothetical protein
MNTATNTSTPDAVRNLIVCDTQFGWNGETTLKLPELLDLQARGWLIEGNENNEFSLTEKGQAVVARALQQAGPADLAEQQVGEVHPDDVAVDAFAAAMKLKMADARAKGRGGWEDPAQCSALDLCRLLRDHVEKGDPRDVANFCMMLWNRQEGIATQVGEVQVARAQFEAWAENRLPLHRDRWDGYAEHATGVSYAAWYAGWQAALAARQPGAPRAWLIHWSKIPLESPEVTTSASRVDAVNALTDRPCIEPLYAAPPAQGVDLGQFRDRIKAAIDRIVNHQCLMRIPVDNTDPDIVLADILRLIEGQRDAAPGPRISQGTHDPSGVGNG